MPDPPPRGEQQRVDEIMAQVDGTGHWQAADTDGANDPAVASRAVWIRAEADWVMDHVIRLLPPDMPLAARIDAITIAIGSVEFLKLTRSKVYQRAEHLVDQLTAMMNIYSPNTRWRLEVWQIAERSTSGLKIAIKRFFLTTSRRDGIALLASAAEQGRSRAAVLLQLARSSGSVSEALSLLHAPEPGWAAVYDVLKFVEDSSVANNKAGKIKEYRRTANWYRHLGESGREPLPDDPPTLAKARTFAFGLLEEWLELRLSEFLRGQSSNSPAAGP